MKFGLSETTTRKICDVFARYPQVERAILYGSRAKGTYKNGSDIDIALQGDGLTLYSLYRIMDDLDELLLPYSIDLSIQSRIADTEVADHIQRVGVAFYERPACAKGARQLGGQQPIPNARR